MHLTDDTVIHPYTDWGSSVTVSVGLELNYTNALRILMYKYQLEKGQGL